VKHPKTTNIFLLYYWNN